jgi:fatty acid amide hydrolase
MLNKISLPNLKGLFTYNNAIKGLAVLVGLSVIKKIIKTIKKKRIEAHWDSVCAEVRKERDEKISSFLSQHAHKVSKDRQEYILKQDLTTIAQLIKTQKVSSVEVTITYAIRIGTIGKDLNLIAHVNFENALKQAEKSDQIIKNAKDINELPPFIGIPMTVKDHIVIAGVPMTLSIANFARRLEKEDSEIIKVLREKGAFPLAVSVIPQCGGSIEASSFLWGDSHNPWNPLKTTGGSSGGEGGLIGSHCSIMGIGSDQAGSIRIPSHYNGCYGFKPTSTRISIQGTNAFGDKMYQPPVHLFGTLGPLCRTADDCTFWAKHMLGQFPDDIYVNQTPFNQEKYSETLQNKKKKIGYLIDLDFCDSTPEVRGVMRDLISQLKQAGHELVPFEFPKFFELIDKSNKALYNLGMWEQMKLVMAGERPKNFFEGLFWLMEQPAYMMKVVKLMLKLSGEKRALKGFENAQALDKQNYFILDRQIRYLVYEFFDFWRQNKFDALICPIMPAPAHDIGHTEIMMSLLKFCGAFNVLDMPACTIPIKLCEDISYPSLHNDTLEKEMQFCMKTAKGLPIAIQVVTRPGDDERCLALMKEIDGFYRFDKNHSPKVFDLLKK